MKTRNMALLIAALGLLLSGCTIPPNADQLPEWVLNPGSRYSTTRYLSATGQGDTLRAAESQAFGRLAGRFKTHIQSSEQVSDEAAERFGSTSAFEKTSNYRSDIQLEAEETLLNVETLEQHRDAKGRIYVLVALNRLDTAQLYEEKIAAKSSRIISLQNDEPGKLEEYAKARQSLILGLENRQLIEQLAVIHRSSAEMLDLPYQLDQLRLRLAQAGNSIRFNVNMQGNQATPFGRKISAVMTGQGFTESSVSDLHISGTVTIQDMNFLRNDIQTVRYQLLLNVKDPLGHTLITLQKEGRESHLSREDARRRAERTVNQLIERELVHRLDVLFTQLAGGNS